MADTTIKLTALGTFSDSGTILVYPESQVDTSHRGPGALAPIPANPIRTVPVTDGEVDVTVAAVASYLVTGTEGDDTAILWTAKTAGAAGNDITVTLADPGGNNQSLSVDVADTDITVNLATDGGGAITSTADQVKAAVAADSPGADDLVTAVDSGASDGSGVVAAESQASLAYGGAALTAGRYVAVGAVSVEVDSGFPGVDPESSTEIRYRHFAVS